MVSKHTIVYAEDDMDDVFLFQLAFELDDHIKHAHGQGDSNNTDGIYSSEQKIDPFVKTEN